MKISWKRNSKLNPQTILEKIEKCQSVSEDGNVGYDYFEFKNAFSALISMIEFPNKIKHEVDIDFIIKKGLKESAIEAKENELRKDIVIKKINEVTSNMLATKEIKYYFLTSLSITQNLPFKRLKFESSSIRMFEGNYPNKFSDRDKLIDNVSKQLSKNHDRYAKVIISVKSKTVSGAANKALRSLDLVRAILSFHTNSLDEMFSDNYSPVNRIRLGESHTLHAENGKVVGDTVWFEPYFVEESSPYYTGEFNRLKKNLTSFINKLKNCKYDEILKEALLMYVRALDDKDNNSALIKLWGALEKLALSSQETNYDLIINRCSFTYKDASYHKQILEHLRESRNQTVHAGFKSNRVKTHCFQLQTYFRALMKFHLSYVDTFKSLEEANRFLDLAAEDTALLVKEKMIKEAIKYRRLN